MSLGKIRSAGIDAISVPVDRVEALAKRTAKSASTAIEPFPPSKLLDAGFIRIGEWTSVSEEVFVLDTSAPREPGVYAFVVDGVIRYIGLTQRGIRTRMAHYVRGHSRQRTSARIKGRILEALAEGRRVEVLVATPEPTEWKELPVLTAPGLEAGLIRLVQPEWNMQGIG
ncbi:GIY-YIG nuclease family protein [Sphingopyxis sp. USTB-05]|uniref:GIY-YIG nuclease family protein n=1 Tax=Sphingopyxis sp. USTB-05 TaxID=2830667 RepID=UPI00207868D1|nr:GIY-YIG nuclease family protein [Sphingopyxis sp. USTB-05]USI76535.1 GIY-YIG nuclease family protein [Sphingopyxis sp. USTB-05]